MRKPLLVSRIKHPDVVYVEVVRGAGIDGGDLVTVAVKRRQGGVMSFLPYLGPRDIAVNKYRLAERVASVTVEAGRLRELYGEGCYTVKEEGSVWRLELGKTGDRYPSVILEIRHYGDHADVKIYLAPG